MHAHNSKNKSATFYATLASLNPHKSRIVTMSETGARRSAAPLNRNEWCILVNVAHYLAGSGPAHNAHTALTSRKRLALVTGVAISTAQEAIRLANSGEELPAITGLVTHIGHPKKTPTTASSN